MDNLEDFSMISNVSSDSIPKLSLCERDFGIGSGEGYSYNATNYDRNNIQRIQKNLSSVEDSYITQSSSEIAFATHTRSEEEKTLEEENVIPKILGMHVNEQETNIHSQIQLPEELKDKYGDPEGTTTTTNTTASTTRDDTYFYEPLICLNTNPSENANIYSEEQGNVSDYSEERNSLKNENLDSDFSAVESDEYSEDEGDSDTWESDNSSTINFGKRLRSSKRPKRCEPGEVYVRCSRNVQGKRCYGKVQYCIYCSIKGKNYNGFTNLSKHILKYHEEESQVAKILEIPKRSPERKLLLEKVRNLGNYEHNMRVLRENKGEIIPWRCPPNPVSYKKYVPCKCCKGFFQKKDLWRHLRACPFNKNSDQPSRGCAKEAAMLLPSTCEASSAVLENVFMKMQADDITSIVKNDKLITLYAEKLYSKHGMDDQCHMMISQKLREIGRLMMGIRKRNNSIDSLSKCLAPQHYQVVYEATREVSGFDESTGKYKTPSLALKIGHALNKCCSIKQGISTEINDEMMEKETQLFQACMSATWPNEVSRNALRTLKEAKWNNPTIVPLAEDILTLQRYISSELIVVEKQLIENPTKEIWKIFCKLCLTSVILLNRKRSGEISKFLLVSYISKLISVAAPQVVSALTPVEREMSREFLKVEILGKDGRIAPFIFTPFNINKLDLLVSTRVAVGVNKENKYLFAHPFEGAETHIRGHDCLREFSKKCGAQQPIALTGMNLKNFISASPY